MVDFKVDFATVINQPQLRFQFDNGQIFTPVNPEAYQGATGQRVIMNYTPRENNTLYINSIANIHTDVIRTEGFSESIAIEPLRIQSVWVGGNHLNMILEILHHSAPHTVRLFQNTDANDIELHFSYSRNQDPVGTSRILHLSFLLSSLRGEADPPVPFRLFINTHDRMREFEMVF